MADKSIDAMLAAIEIYNKPNFSYREECFAILAINAWELLLKARLLQLSGNKLGSILLYEKRQKGDGSEGFSRMKNRCGNDLSVGIFKSFDLLRDDYGDKINPTVRKNLEMMCEIRDNAIHFFNKGPNLSQIVQELGTACLKNYLALIRQWFGFDMSRYNFYMMPLAFAYEGAHMQAVSSNSHERKLINFLQSEVEKFENLSSDDFRVSMRLGLLFAKSKDSNAPKVQLSNDPDAVKINLSEEDVREKYPWDYDILTTRLRKRFVDFKANEQYHTIRKPLESDEKFCWKRYLDPANRKSSVKKFYNPNIVKEFDRHYTKRDFMAGPVNP